MPPASRTSSPASAPAAARPRLRRRPETRRRQALRTLFLQETIARGVLMPYIAPSFSHDQAAVDETLEASAAALRGRSGAPAASRSQTTS